jgi:hypothetical protein
VGRCGHGADPAHLRSPARRRRIHGAVLVELRRNLLTTDDDHPRGYYIAHTLLILANLAIAGFLVWLASRGMKHYDDERVRQFYDDRAYDEARKSARKERAAAR